MALTALLLLPLHDLQPIFQAKSERRHDRARGPREDDADGGPDEGAGGEEAGQVQGLL